jgi:AraC-like DNA-binding protein
MLLLTRVAAQPDTDQPLSNRPSSTDPWLDAVLARIHAAKGGRPTIADLSQETGVSASHLRALFRDRFGVSLGRYLRDYHIKRSIGMLSSSSVTVTQAAELCGYGSVYSFSRAFRRTMGCSPIQYIRRMRR